jgi:hypothetical protein
MTGGSPPKTHPAAGSKSNAWFTACQAFCLLQVLAGATLGATSFTFLFSFARVIGAVSLAIHMPPLPCCSCCSCCPAAHTSAAGAQPRSAARPRSTRA